MNRTGQDIGDELYGLAPPAFTATRDRYIAEAKTAGNRALATELGGMKRPSVAAGLVNLVALRSPRSVAELIQLGQTIREAQGNVTPIQIRDLSARRRKELDTVVALAQSLAAERGDAAPSRAVLTEVESTFAAAMADDDAARLVTAGRTTKALSYSGFGQPDQDAGGVFAATPAPSRAAPSPARHVAENAGGRDAGGRDARGRDAAKAAATEAAERAAAEQAERRAAAAQRVNSARQQLAETSAAEAAAEAEAQRVTDQITDLRNQLDIAQRDARAARQARLAAERDLASAERLQRRHS